MTAPFRLPPMPHRDSRHLREVTPLPPGREREFAAWLARNRVTDYGHPQSRFDYVGAFLAGEGRGDGEEGHFLDTFKQHGHESFSNESMYADDPANDPQWFDDIRLRPVRSPSPDATVSRRVRTRVEVDPKVVADLLLRRNAR